MNLLEQIILKLIDLKKEGVYWDFKQEHHTSTVDFIHDVICLSNTRYDGDRYLIFGIDDDCNILNLSDTKKQADIIDMLRNAHFADDTFPDITLEDLSIKENKLQVLTIKNTTNKPYYLVQEKKDSSNGKTKILNAGTIYTRVMDTNTPKNRVASSKDIEYMWKERFGLTQTPIERCKIYLKDFDNWEQEDEIWHYKLFPEFTIQPLEHNYCEGCETREWARGEIGYHYSSGNGTSVFGFYYHSTLLKKVCCVQFDGGKKYIVNPDWEAIGKGRIYFYLEDSFDYAYQKFLIQERNEDFSKNLRIGIPNSLFDIPLFKSRTQLNEFLQDVRLSFAIKENDCLPITDEAQQNELFYKYIQYYLEWSRM